MAWIWGSGAVLIVLAIVLLSNAGGEIYFSRRQEDDRLFVNIRGLYGLVKYRFDVPVIKFHGFLRGISAETEKVNAGLDRLIAEEHQHLTPEKVMQFYENAKELLAHVVDFNGWMKGTMSHVRCTKLFWETRVGFGDAPETAITTGLIWGIKSSLLTYAFQHIQLRAKPNILVQPQYNRALFTTEFVCIAKIRLGYAIIAGLFLLVRILKVKGGLQTWQSILFKA